MTAPRTHDLLHLPDPARALAAMSDAPGWVADALGAVPWVVVRRAAAPPGQIAVGVRGTTRAERHADILPLAVTGRQVRPEALAARAESLPENLPAACALRRARPLLDATELPWGPTGSVGFQLATGASTATQDSDLDLVIRIDGPLALLGVSPILRDLHTALLRLPARVDCLLEAEQGAIALGELVGGASHVLLRTGNGPCLVPVPHDADSA